MTTANAFVAKEAVKQGRAYSTSFADHKDLLHRMAKKCYGRVANLNASVTYEDVFQDLCVAFVKAAEGYDPSKGITFSAYLGQAVMNEFNRKAEKWSNDYREIGQMPFADIERDDEEAHDFLETYSSDASRQPGVEELCVQSDEIRERIANLTPKARMVVRELLVPSEGIKKTFEGLKAHYALRVSMGVSNRDDSPKAIDLRVIRRHYGFGYAEFRTIKREIQQKLGVDLG